MSGFSEESKRIFNLLFDSDSILIQGFAYNMVQYVMAGCQNERRKKKKTIHKFLNMEKDKKYMTCGLTGM